MSATLTDILNDVSEELEDFPEEGSASADCDGVTTRFHMPDSYIIDDGTFDASLVETATSTTTGLTEDETYTVDYRTGWVTLIGAYATDPPDEGYTLECSYTYRHWRSDLVRRLVNDGFAYLFPSFYAIVEDEFTGDSETTDFDLASAGGNKAEGVITVVSDGYTLKPHRDYRVLRPDAATSTLRIFTAPFTDVTVTVTFACRPEAFETDASTLADIGLPETIRAPLVYYVCWKLMTQKVRPLMRTDLTNTYDREAMTTFNDQMNGLTMYRNLLELEIARTKMPPWTARGI